MTRNNMTELKSNRNSNILMISIAVEVTIFFTTLVMNMYSMNNNYAPAMTSVLGMLGSIYYYRRAERFAYIYIDNDNEDNEDNEDEKFRKYVIACFLKKGYRIFNYVPEEFKDYIVMNKKGDKIIIHTGNCGAEVSTRMVQELVISMWNFEAEKGYIITNSELSDEARNMACSCNVEILDKNQLFEIR